MKNTIKKKLSINKKTLKSLKARQLQAVVGSGSPVDSSTDPYASSNPFGGFYAAVSPGYIY